MPKEVSIFRWMLLLVAMLVFGGMSWIGDGPIGNVGAWFAVLIAIGWPVLAGRNCVARLPDRDRS